MAGSGPGSHNQTHDQRTQVPHPRRPWISAAGPSRALQSPWPPGIGGHLVTSLAPRPGVVLVHGAYADGSSWSAVIERLHRAGLAATAV
jgi:hypothetical protein